MINGVIPLIIITQKIKCEDRGFTAGFKGKRKKILMINKPLIYNFHRGI